MDLNELKMFGSFQDQSRAYSSENPLEEGWAQLGRLATNEALVGVKPRHAVADWDQHLAYAKVRVNQSLEFRAAGHAGTLLTAPLTLYYSFLNITRAYLSLFAGVLSKGHGLHFKTAANILDCSAAPSDGTYTDYLDQNGLSWDSKQPITLRAALGCIVELWPDLGTPGSPTTNHVQFVHVDASMSGDVVLRFPGYPKDLASCWADDFPHLVSVCTLDAAGSGLLVKRDAINGTSYIPVAHFVRQMLLPHLTITEGPLWWLMRSSELAVHLDRLAYYYVAMFILGSAVRYEPELVLGVSSADSGVGWLLRRFIGKAERYFPQLLLSEIHRRQIYM